MRSEENEKSDSFFEKDPPLLLKFAYSIGLVIFIGRMLYGKYTATKQPHHARGLVVNKKTGDKMKNDYIKVTFAKLADGSEKISRIEQLRELDPEVQRIFEGDGYPINSCKVTTETPSIQAMRLVGESIYLHEDRIHIKKLQKGEIYDPKNMEWIRKSFAACSERLAQIEEQVHGLAENPITETITVTGSEEKDCGAWALIDNYELAELIVDRFDLNSTDDVRYIDGYWKRKKARSLVEGVEGKITVVDCRHSDGSVCSWAVSHDDPTLYAIGDIVEVEHLGDYLNEYLPVVDIRQVLDDALAPDCRVVRKVGGE